MWIIDTGMLNLFFPEEEVWNSPRLFVYDITVSPPKLLRLFKFPLGLVEPGNAFLNDIVVDVERNFAFITNSIGDGGLWAYDFESDNARYWTGPSTQVEPNQEDFDIQGTLLTLFMARILGISHSIGSGNYTIVTPSDGIALSPDASTLYYCSLSGINLYSMPTALFRNFSVPSGQVCVTESFSRSDNKRGCSWKTPLYCLARKSGKAMDWRWTRREFCILGIYCPTRSSLGTRPCL